MFIILSIILISIYLQITVTTIPMFLVVLIVMVILNKEIWAAGAGFAGGMLIDAAAVRTVGTSSIFLIMWLFFILLYKRKYEINNLPFAAAVAFGGALFYLWLIGANDIFIQSVVSGAMCVILLTGLRGMFLSKRVEVRYKSNI